MCTVATVVAALSLAPLTWLGAQAIAPPGSTAPAVAAARTTRDIRVDGLLSETAWRTADVARDFRQVEPDHGAPASLATEVRVLYDDRNLYIGVVAHDPQGATGVRARDLRRDFDGATNDYVGIVLDPFRERRTAVLLLAGPYGNQHDAQVLDGGLLDTDWDGLWTVRTAMSDSGWTAEFVVPWATLRYPAESGAWAINFVRATRRLNETSGWSPWPRQLRETRTEFAGVLAALEAPARQASRVRTQPYVVFRGERALDAGGATVPAYRRDMTVGGDVRWAVTPSTFVDVTVNPDFGQADADRQIVNLSQFAVTLPERRAFFLENRTGFTVGDGQFEPFASRRIGLDAAGRPIPIDAGVRLVSRSAVHNVGALLIQQRGGGTTSRFGVARYARNVGDRSRAGVLATSRVDLDGETGDGSVRQNHVLALDGFTRPRPTIAIRGFLAGSVDRSAAAEASRLGLAGQLAVGYEGRIANAQWLHEYVGADYRAGAGVVPRTDYWRLNSTVALDLRPAWRPNTVRRLYPSLSVNVAQRASDQELIEATLSARPVEIQLSSGARFGAIVRADRLRPPATFSPVPGLEIAPGTYDNLRGRLDVASDPSRSVAFRAGHVFGGYFDGRFANWDMGLNVSPDPRLAVAVDYVRLNFREVGGGGATRTTHLLTPEVRLAANPRMQLTTFYQYNTAARQAALNLRLAWEYAPLSFVYLVYNGREPIALDSAFGTPSRSVRQLLLKLSYVGQL